MGQSALDLGERPDVSSATGDRGLRQGRDWDFFSSCSN